MRQYVECLKKYATFSGRSQRKEYWMFLLVNIIVLVALTIIETVVRGDAAGGGSVLAVLYNLAVFVPTLAAGVRRMHDTDHRGWWLLVPFVNFVFACRDGGHGDNRFGPDPKATSANAEPPSWAAARA